MGAREFRDLVNAHLPPDVTPAQAALAGVVKQFGVTTVIPGARSAAQARINAKAGTFAALPTDFLTGVHAIYDEHFRDFVHPRW